jgi:hypothetical protein
LSTDICSQNPQFNLDNIGKISNNAFCRYYKIKLRILRMIIQHSVTLRKVADRQSSQATEQVKQIVTRSLSGGRAERGWKCNIPSVQYIETTKPKHYIAKFKLICEPRIERLPETIENEFQNIINIIAKAGNQPKWSIYKIDENPVKEKLEGRQQTVGYAAVEIPQDWEKFFSHIYYRDDQINIIMSRIYAAIDSNWQNRFHCALVGDPASGKTETARAFKTMLGEAAVLEYDATATTAAGAIKDLDSRDELPRVMIVEEIEKADEKDFRWLLGVMDWRAEIRKLNYRQNIHRETKMLCIVTINNYQLFRRLMEGALSSRAGDAIWFPKPDRKLLQKILEREVEKIKGKKAWIEPTLDYAEKVNMTDPRPVTAICLSGKDNLLNHSYQDRLLRIRMPD